jgi:ribosomal protein S6--L-glutamate ligase
VDEGAIRRGGAGRGELAAASAALRGLCLGFLERPHPAGYRGALADELVPLLRDAGARVEVVHAELGVHRLDEPPPWHLVVLKSGSAAALHLAAAAEAWGVRAVNTSEATRLAQDKLATAAILRRAGLPIAPARLAWIDPARLRQKPGNSRAGAPELLEWLDHRPLVLKAARGSQGSGVWMVQPGRLADEAAHLPAGPYLVMDWIPHAGEDLKVYAAGAWQVAVERSFPARTLEAKRGRPAGIPDQVARATREVGRLLGLTCYGCDFIRGPDGWVLVDVNAFPGYKGAQGAAAALLTEIARVAAEAQR